MLLINSIMKLFSIVMPANKGANKRIPKAHRKLATQFIFFIRTPSDLYNDLSLLYQKNIKEGERLAKKTKETMFISKLSQFN